MARDLSHDVPPTAPPTAPSAAPQQPQQQQMHQSQRMQQPQQPQQQQQQQGLDPGAWPLIRQSAARLSRNQDAVIRQLHYDITGLIPESAVAPSLDMWVFCERMVQSLFWVALTDQPPHVIVDTLRQVGAQNWYEGFPDAQYASVAHALVQTVHYLSGNDWSASTGSAWISYFMWSRPYFLAGAQQAGAQQAAAEQAAAQQAAAQRAAAEQEAARVKALSRDKRGGHGKVVGDVNIEKVASLLDEDDDNVGYGSIMLSMTRSRREPPRHHDSGSLPIAPGEGFEPSFSAPKALVLPG
jgi:hypothetical protein